MAAVSREEAWDDKVTSLLECPVCSEFSSPPIHQCTNGHIICSGCLQKVTQCPVCRIDLVPHRSLLAERLSEMCLVPCPNADVGCRSRQYHADLPEHACKCPFRLYKCELGAADKCPWIGRRGTLRNHVLRFHKFKYSDCGSRTTTIPDFETATREDWMDVSILFTFQQMFMCYLKVDTAHEKLYGFVKFIGPEDNAKEFLYKFEMRTENCSREITHRNAVCVDTMSIDSIIKTRQCFVVDTDIAKSFVKDNKLSVMVKVIKIRSLSINNPPINVDNDGTSIENERICVIM